jgi:amino acid transporter
VLLRAIRKWELVALVLNFIVGAGIFGLPSQVHALAGEHSVLAYVACAVPIFLIILCFAEVSSRFTETGGLYLYGRAAFGPLVGFEIGWLAWLARLTGFAALCNLFADYLAVFIPPMAARGATRATTIAVVVTALTFVNLRGVRLTSAVNNVFTIGKLLPLLLIVIVGSMMGAPTAAAAPPAVDFSAAVLLLVFAFTGFENAVIPAGEARDPRRHLPFALIVGTAVTTVLYIGIQAVSARVLPDLAASQRPLADVGARLFGGYGAGFIALGALVSILGTLNGVLLAGSRLLFAMAEQGQVPPWLAATHPRHRTPHAAILVTSVGVLLLTVTGTFLAAVRLSTVIRLVTYAITCAALPILRRRAGQPAQFVVPGGTVVAVVALALIGWLFSSSTAADAWRVAGIAAAGLVFYRATARRWRPVPSEAVS